MNTVKKTFIVTMMVLATLGLRSQSEGADLKLKIQSVMPELNLENKMLFINVWQSSDFESRQNNKEFLRVSEIYKGARLKNGQKGVYFINISLDNDNTTWEISLKKDSIFGNNNFNTETSKFDAIVKYFKNTPGNIVINSNNEVVGKNIKKDECFPLFRSFITR